MATIEPMTGRYVHVEVGGVTYRTYFESNGSGTPLVCLHTAGADSLEYRHMLADDDFTKDFQVTDPLTWPQEKQRIASEFRTRTRDEWCAHFEQFDACVTPVLSIDEAHQHPHNQERHYIDKVDDVMQPGCAPRFSRTPGLGPRPVPEPGEHTRAVLQSLGIDDHQIDNLKERGVV